MPKRNKEAKNFIIPPQNIKTISASSDNIVAIKELDLPEDPEARSIVKDTEASIAFALRNLWVVQKKEDRHHLRGWITNALWMQRKGLMPPEGPRVNIPQSLNDRTEQSVGFLVWIKSAIETLKKTLNPVELSKNEYRIDEVGKILEVSRQSVYRYIAAAKLQKIPNKSYPAISKQSLIDFIAKNEEAPRPVELFTADTAEERKKLVELLLSSPAANRIRFRRGVL